MWGDYPHDASATSDNPLIVARERDFRQGAALDPSNGRGLEAYAEFLRWILERPEESKSVLKRALWVDPMSPSARFADAQFSLFDNGVRTFEQKTLQVLELDPNFVPALQYYGKLRWLIEGRLAEGIQIIEHAIALDPKNSLARHTVMTVYLDLGDAKAARRSSRRNAAKRACRGAARDARRRLAACGPLAAYNEEGWTRDDDECEFWQSEATARLCVENGRTEPGDCLHQIEVLFRQRSAAHLEVCNFRAAVYLSQLLAAAGQADQASGAAACRVIVERCQRGQV